MKRTIKCALALVLVLSLFSGLPGALALSPDPGDISGHWAQNTLQTWIDLDLLQGYGAGSYRPNASVTRAEFMAMANRVMAYTKKSADLSRFSDLSSSDWFYDEVSKALAAGYVTGTGEHTVSPADPISREQAAAMILRIEKRDPAADTALLNYFSDSPSLSSWAAPYRWAAA